MYTKYYGLTYQPFEVLTKTPFFCSLSTQERAFKAIVRCLKSNEPFILINGEVGVGKTVLYSRLNNLLNKYYTVLNFNHSCYSIRDLYRRISTKISAECTDNFIIEDLERNLIVRLKQKRKTILLIDDAHSLSDELLEQIRILSNLEYQGKKLLQIVLFAQPELAERLSSKKLRQITQRITFVIQLGSLSYDEMRYYIQHRLNKAGYSDGELFKKGALKKLYKKSNGIPRIINKICHKSLLSAMINKRKIIKKKDVYFAIKDEENIFLNKQGNLFFRQKKFIILGLCALFIIMLLIKING